jgi:hypothetical protein
MHLLIAHMRITYILPYSGTDVSGCVDIINYFLTDMTRQYLVLFGYHYSSTYRTVGFCSEMSFEYDMTSFVLCDCYQVWGVLSGSEYTGMT